MKYVVKCTEHALEIIQVPKSFKECSACGEWKEDAGEEFKDRYGYRTNCKACYELPKKEFDRVDKAVNEKRRTMKYCNLSSDKQKLSFMTVKELIDLLSKLPQEARISCEYQGVCDNPSEPKLVDKVGDIEIYMI